MPSWCAFPQVVANAGAWWPEQNHLLANCFIFAICSLDFHWQSIGNATFSRNQGPNPQMPFRWQVVPNLEGFNDAELHLADNSTRLRFDKNIQESCWRITSATCLAEHQSFCVTLHGFCQTSYLWFLWSASLQPVEEGIKRIGFPTSHCTLQAPSG